MRRLACDTMFLLACSTRHEPPPPPPPAPPPPPPAEKKKIGPVDYGSCTLKVTGAFEAEETIPGDAKAAKSKYWQAEDERGAVPMPALSVNCAGKDLRIALVSAPDANVPFGIGNYDVGKNGQIVLLGRAGDQLSDFNGTVEIDDFTTKHVAGKLDVTARQGRARKKVAITGSFDLACPGMAGCAK
jgi:hypothetical protein